MHDIEFSYAKFHGGVWMYDYTSFKDLPWHTTSSIAILMIKISTYHTLWQLSNDRQATFWTKNDDYQGGHIVKRIINRTAYSLRFGINTDHRLVTDMWKSLSESTVHIWCVIHIWVPSEALPRIVPVQLHPRAVFSLIYTYTLILFASLF